MRARDRPLAPPRRQAGPRPRHCLRPAPGAVRRLLSPGQRLGFSQRSDPLRATLSQSPPSPARPGPRDTPRRFSSHKEGGGTRDKPHQSVGDRTLRVTWFFRSVTTWEFLRPRHTPLIPGAGISTLGGLLGLRGSVMIRSCVDICSHVCEHPAHPRVIESHGLGGVLRVWVQVHAHHLVAFHPFQPIDAPPQYLDLIGKAGLHHGPR